MKNNAIWLISQTEVWNMFMHLNLTLKTVPVNPNGGA